MHTSTKHQTRWLIGILVGVFCLFLVNVAQAAEFASDDMYHLEAGEVVPDDLYVAGNRIYIDGTVEGDLVAAGGVIEITGLVEGDVIAAGSSIRISGEVQDDARIAGAGITINGTIADDLFASAGGSSDFSIPGVDQQMIQGFHLEDNAQINGEAFIFGGRGIIGGTIDENLHAFMNQITLNTQVAGNAELAGNQIDVQDATRIAGTLRYQSAYQSDIPANSADEVIFTNTAETTSFDPVIATLNWLWHTLLILVGFALLGSMVLRFAPNLLTKPVQAINTHPVSTGLSGLLASVGFIFIPIVSIFLVFLMVLFGGWFPGTVLGLFLFTALALLWFLSPLITGMWLGQKLRSISGKYDFAALLAGILLVALLAQLPLVGWVIYLISFIFAIGAVIRARTMSPSSTTTPATT
ncbi:MAG: polymer-forming cytoskeletal protein [Chloroflexaceae bacterium]|nr:polymer-forming cytoskeletal protein [Chloroflexaceae bacterium]